MYLGHFWQLCCSQKVSTHMYNCTLPSQTYRVWFWCNSIKQQHLSARSFYTLQEWYHPLTSVISLPVIQMDSYMRSTHVWKSPARPSFRRETRIEKDCRFFHVTQSINLLFIIPLFSTDERWGWRIGGNVHSDHDKEVWFMLFVIFFSFLFSSVLCNKSAFYAFWPSSAWLVLIHWLWEHHQSSSPHSGVCSKH